MTYPHKHTHTSCIFEDSLSTSADSLQATKISVTERFKPVPQCRGLCLSCSLQTEPERALPWALVCLRLCVWQLMSTLVTCLQLAPWSALTYLQLWEIVKSRCVCTCLCAMCYFTCQMSDVQHFQDDWNPQRSHHQPSNVRRQTNPPLVDSPLVAELKRWMCVFVCVSLLQ